MKFARIPAALVLGLATLLALAADNPIATPYSLRELDSAAFTSMRRQVARGGAIPFDKRYGELTPEQQFLVKSQYDFMPEGDEPPFPLNGLERIYRALGDAQALLLAEGELAMVVTVGAGGQASAVSVLKSPNAEMTQAAAAILLLEPYKPAVCRGVPCTMDFPFRISLNRR